MEIVKNIAAIIGCIMSAISLITLCTKAGRAGIKRAFGKYTHNIEVENLQQAEAISKMQGTLEEINGKLQDFDERFVAIETVSKQDCRDKIKDIYYRYSSIKRIPLYERKTADIVFELYSKKFHGNSYAELLYNEIKKWDIDNTYDPATEE